MSWVWRVKLCIQSGMEVTEGISRLHRYGMSADGILHTSESEYKI